MKCPDYCKGEHKRREARRKIVVAAPERTKRIPCLKCGRMFLSTGKGNRLCEYCERYLDVIYDTQIAEGYGI